MKDPKKLSDVQDTVWNDPRWKSTPGGPTHCNQASLAVANGLGCHDFDPPAGRDPYTADQLFTFFQRHNPVGDSHFLEKDMADVQNLANAGSLVFAIVPSWTLQEDHGHIVSITPGEMVHSANLGKDVPICLNIGNPAISGRSVGINWAFPMHTMAQRGAIVRFFAWKETL